MKISYTPNFNHFYLFYYERLKRLGYVSKLLGIVLLLSSLSFKGVVQVLNLIFIIILTTPSLWAYVTSLLSFLRYKKELRTITYTIDDNGIDFTDEKKVSSGQTKWEFFSSYSITKRYLVIQSTKSFLPVIFLAKSRLPKEDWLKIIGLVKGKIPRKSLFSIIKIIPVILIHLIFYVLLIFTLIQLLWSFLRIYNFECVGLKYCNVVIKPKNSQWQEYTNITYKYSFKYPPDMYVDKSFYNPNNEKKHVRLLFFNPTKKEIPVKNGFGNMVYENEITIMFLGDNLSGEEIEAYDRQYKNFYANDKESVTQPEFIRGKIQYRYEKKDKINGFYYLNSIFVVDNRYFEISLRAPYVTDQLKDTYKKILDSVSVL